MRSVKSLGAILLAITALNLIPRLLGINLFATIDEPYWLTAGSDFYYALGQRQFANTVYDYHPAVTTMWIVTAAMLLYFPQYRGFGQGYFDVYKDSLDQFLLDHGRTPLGLLTTARVLQVVVIVVLLGALFLLLRRLFGERTAAAAVLMVSFDPFFLGHSRLLNHEGMMALFALISVLAALACLLRARSWWLLLASGAAAGLAQLTKSSSIVVVPLVALLFILAAAFRGRLPSRPTVAGLARDLGVWLLTALAVYVLVWPGMWVSPGKMLGEVFGNAFSYAFHGVRLAAASAEPSMEAQPQLADIAAYVQSILWRTTPIVWLGVILAVFALFRMDGVRRLMLAVVALLGALFVLLFGLASGRNSAHYVLTSYAALDIVAAGGLAEVAAWAEGRLGTGRWQVIPTLALAAVVVVQATSGLGFFPYYYNYYSPIMEGLDTGRQNPNFGYGEGLDLAAVYLDQKPDATASTAMAFYGRGPFSFFYRGRTEPLKTVYADAENVPQLQQILHKADYLVIYYALQHGRNAPSNVMRALVDAVPEKSIFLNGIEYVRIYALKSMPADFYDRLWP